MDRDPGAGGTPQVLAGLSAAAGAASILSSSAEENEGAMQVRFRNRTLQLGSDSIGADLRESNDIVGDPAWIRQRLGEDGYLLVRGLRDRNKVLAARLAILEKLAERGALDPHSPLAEGVIRQGSDVGLTTTVRGKDELKTLPAFRELAQSREPFQFFQRLLGGEVRSFDFQWLRVAGPGAESAIHCDVVFMGRGTKDLYTCWTPLGDVALDMGPVDICLGSHRFEKLKETYGRMDVDRDLIEGHFSKRRVPARCG
jgi:hypothetical protein